jgi:hypothetical protein
VHERIIITIKRNRKEKGKRVRARMIQKRGGRDLAKLHHQTA